MPTDGGFLADSYNKGTLLDCRGFPSQPGGSTMDENRVEGTARNVGGKVQEGVGRLTGDAHARAEGLANQRQAGHKIYTAKLPTPRVRQQRP